MSKYVKVPIDEDKFMEAIRELTGVLDKNKIAIDEITLHLRDEVNNNAFKIEIFKDFIEFLSKLKEEQKDV